jgi:hypothetical protein
MLQRIPPIGEPQFKKTKALAGRRNPEDSQQRPGARISPLRPGSERAVSSAVERHVYTVLVGGSIPSLPIFSSPVGKMPSNPEALPPPPRRHAPHPKNPLSSRMDPAGAGPIVAVVPHTHRRHCIRMGALRSSAWTALPAEQSSRSQAGKLLARSSLMISPLDWSPTAEAKISTRPEGTTEISRSREPPDTFRRMDSPRQRRWKPAGNGSK